MFDETLFLEIPYQSLCLNISKIIIMLTNYLKLFMNHVISLLSLDLLSESNFFYIFDWLIPILLTNHVIYLFIGLFIYLIEIPVLPLFFHWCQREEYWRSYWISDTKFMSFIPKVGDKMRSYHYGIIRGINISGEETSYLMLIAIRLYSVLVAFYL